MTSQSLRSIPRGSSYFLLTVDNTSEDSAVIAPSHHAVHARPILTEGRKGVQMAVRSLFYYLLTDYNCVAKCSVCCSSQMEVEPLILVLEAVPTAWDGEVPSAFLTWHLKFHTHAHRTYPCRMSVNVFWQLGRPPIFLQSLTLFLMMLSEIHQLNTLEMLFRCPPCKSWQI